MRIQSSSVYTKGGGISCKSRRASVKRGGKGWVKSCAKPPVIVIHTFLHPPLASGSSSVPLVTRVRNNGAHLNFITQREESTNTKPAALHTSNTHTGFHQTLQKKKKKSKDQRLTMTLIYSAFHPRVAF